MPGIAVIIVKNGLNEPSSNLDETVFHFVIIPMGKT